MASNAEKIALSSLAAPFLGPLPTIYEAYQALKDKPEDEIKPLSPPVVPVPAVPAPAEAPPESAPTLTGHLVKSGPVQAPTIKMPEMDIPVGAPAPAPAAQAAPPPVPASAPPDEVAAAQAAADAKRRSVGAGILNFLSGFSSHGDELGKGIQDRINSPLAQLLQRREEARKAKEDQDKQFEFDRKKAADATTGPLAERAQLLARLRHPEWTNAQIKQFTPSMAQDLDKFDTFAELKKNHEDERTHAEKALAQQAHEGAANRANQVALHKMDDAAKLQERLAALSAAKHQTTPALAAELPKVSNISGAPAAIKELSDAHAKIGPIEKAISALTAGHLNIGDAGAYERLKKTKVGPLATALYPLAKGENPALLEAAEEQLPGVSGFESNAQDKLRQLTKTTADTKDNFISGLEAAGLPPEQAAQLRAVGGAAGAPAAHYQTPDAHAAAVKWALANPHNPDAQRILALNGAQ